MPTIRLSLWFAVPAMLLGASVVLATDDRPDDPATPTPAAMVDGSGPVPYLALVEELSLRDVPRAAAILVVGKRALGRAIIEEVSQTVEDPDEVSNEIRDLLNMLEVKPR